MSSRNRVLGIGACLALIALAFLLLVKNGFAGAQRDADDKDSAPASEKAPEANNDGNVHLNSTAVERAGIVTAPLRMFSGRTESQVVAVVISPQELLDLRQAYVAASLQFQKAQASLTASRAEYERLRDLNREDKTASDKAVEAAAATYRSDQDTLANAQEELKLASSNAVQRWGSQVAQWISAGGPSLDAVLQARRVLLQVTPPDSKVPPATLTLYSNASKAVAWRISLIPKIDPRFQQASYLYTVAARPGFAPGANLTASAPMGEIKSGLLLPASAVLHWEGKDWIYIQLQPGVFSRLEVSLTQPFPGGWLLSQSRLPGPVVITGAQQLLSQEFQSVTQQAGDED